MDNGIIDLSCCGNFNKILDLYGYHIGLGTFSYLHLYTNQQNRTAIKCRKCGKLLAVFTEGLNLIETKITFM